MEIREYKTEDCIKMAELFYDTVHTVNARDYTKEQLNAWADGNVDIRAWNESFLKHFTLTAEADGLIVGFGDMDPTGYLDRLYVHRNYQGRGVGTELCRSLESWIAGEDRAESGIIHTIATHASITARPFFEYMGYHVVKEQQVRLRGQTLTNYVMEKHIAVSPERILQFPQFPVMII